MTQRPEKAFWNKEETTALVDYLHAHRAEAGDGGNFKTVTFQAASVHLTSLLTQGPAKTSKMCKGKWASLKKTYSDIESFRSQSGMHWDNEKGASIEGEAAGIVWDGFVGQKTNSNMCAFRNKGWEYYEKLQEILPSFNARGSHLHEASKTVPQGHPPSDDEDDMQSQAASGPSQSSIIPSLAPTTAAPPTNANIANPSNLSSSMPTPPPPSGPMPTPPPPSDPMSITVPTSDPTSRPIIDSPPNSMPTIESINLSGRGSSSTISSGKRKHSTISSEWNDPDPTPSEKKQFKGKSKPRSSQSSAQSSMALATQIAPVAAYNNMQASVNRLADAAVMWMSPAEDPMVTALNRAMALVQDIDDGLTSDEQLVLISRFVEDPKKAVAYLSMKNEDLRKGWIRLMLASL